ncbi:uncharacterized protein METZ01_LOCUS489748, partial [marine metagenome]
MNIDDNKSYKDFNDLDQNLLEPVDYWILSRLHRTIHDVNSYLKDYKLNEAVKTIYTFVWKDYCDWYIEFAKSRIYSLDNSKVDTVIVVARHILENILKLLHPYTPFITEEIWSYFHYNEKDFLVTSQWPKKDNGFINNSIESEVNFIMKIISNIRNLKSDLNISPKKVIKLVCRGLDNKTSIVIDNQTHLKSLVKVENIECSEEVEKPDKSATIVVNDVEFFIPLVGL